jgi:HEAT repeat protein
MPTPFDQALAALATYDAGSSRATLLEIDRAVAASLRDPAARPPLEQRLITALEHPLSAIAREYLCQQLRLIGSPTAVPALAALLADPKTSHVARIALEALPPAESARALRNALPQLTGTLKCGAIDSLGRLRDPDAVPLLQPLLDAPDAAVAAAAATALGQIGTPDAATALRPAITQAPEPLRPALADAALACTERLHRSNHTDEARQLAALLDTAGYPTHVRQAALRKH